MNRYSVCLVSVVCLLSALPCLAVDWDALQPIGPVASYQKSERGVMISCQDQSQVAVEVLAPDLVRVRVGFRKAIPDLHSWAVAKEDWTPVQWTVGEGPNELHVRTSQVDVVITRSPLKVAFADPRSGEVWHSESSPAEFDPKTGAIGQRNALGFEEHFYGLGEKAAPLDKRRGRYTMWNTDSYRYSEGTDPIYQSIPFYMGLKDGSAYGIFYDNSYRSSFDFGSMSEEFTQYTADGGALRYYFFAGPSMKNIVERYTELTGRIPMYPRWTLGHQQSRYSYYPDSEVMKVADTYRKHDLPLEAIHLDINYMNGYRDFTWDPVKFPDPKEMTAALAKQGVKIVTIVDPGVKYQPAAENAQASVGAHPELGPQKDDYYVYDEGAAKDYFLKRSSGKLYIGKVWPGPAVFVDYTKPAAAQWWGGLMRAYLGNGVSGIWTDMNEPSDFVDQTGATQMDVRYYDGGRWSGYAENRNLFALQMAKATYEGLRTLRPNERPYVITRAGFAGVQRYSSMWTGDVASTWDALALTLPMFESLGLSGETFVGADVGGFAGNTNAQLLTRWYEAGLFSPMLRNHAEMGSYDHEPWRFGPTYEDIIRKYLKLRYRMLPYLYTAIEEAHRTGLPVYRPLVLEFQDDANVFNLQDEAMIGSRLLIAPIVKPDEHSRPVYLPKGVWYDYWTNQRIEGGRVIQVEAPLDKLPLFVRGGSVLPLGPEMNYTSEKAIDPLTLVAYPDEGGAAKGSVYEDDGISFQYEGGVFRRTDINLEGSNAKLTVSGKYELPRRQLVVMNAASSAKATVTDEGKGASVALQ